MNDLELAVKQLEAAFKALYEVMKPTMDWLKANGYMDNEGTVTEKGKTAMRELHKKELAK